MAKELDAALKAAARLPPSSPAESTPFLTEALVGEGEQPEPEVLYDDRHIHLMMCVIRDDGRVAGKKIVTLEEQVSFSSSASPAMASWASFWAEWVSTKTLNTRWGSSAERKSRSRETALSKTDVMILRLLLPHDVSSAPCFFATVATALHRLAHAVGATADDVLTRVRTTLFVFQEEQAAVKIQASFRGHKARLQVKEKAAAAEAEAAEAAAAEAETPVLVAMTEEMAAVKIQAVSRGHLARKQMAAKKEEEAAAVGPEPPAEEESKEAVPAKGEKGKKGTVTAATKNRVGGKATTPNTPGTPSRAASKKPSFSPAAATRKPR